mmetsp:Transcript_12768/g.28046  ORF Transcript_12768/g.28046 Transcript_12768/m.28046 type:complete len:443 (-) Transcript_12768:183-1511(-)|eukprot:CAMPEP_0168750146 /NCGR_PEP_ID=MMETSP0724-20121128/17106_1 /TAXON_ID=265536 /ORGANISM="Amphiprora sp., Strain CCMP467" /LENGTH=442 /DNA_ID=CAMNT_0008798127 /DNA_START=102 /DNA_END=1430 /DNA_ORIENTATION=-
MVPSIGSKSRHKAAIVDPRGLKLIDRNSRGSTFSSTSSLSDTTSRNSSKDLDIEQESGSRLLDVKHRRRWEIHESVLDTIGQTPIVRLQRMAPEGVDIYVKLEAQNPGGSLKDRLAMGVIEWAEGEGLLTPGQTVVEASSGNAGIGLAMVCASKGYPFVCVMSESFSVERRKVMRFLGAKVILTDPKHKATGMIMKAQELADKHGYFYPKQFENEANAWMHEQTTGAEICRAFAKSGLPLDHFFMAYGTGGCALGVGRAFKKRGMATRIHLCEPSNAPMVSSGIKTNYPKEGEGPSTSFDTAHAMWSPHMMQGWAVDFIPKLVATAKEEKVFHGLAHVSSSAAIATSQALAKKEGIFTGISGGGILAAALAHAGTCQKGTNILCILPDTGERYLSTVLFKDIPEDMTPEEQELADTTPGRAPPAPPSMHGILPEDTDQLFDM